MNGAAMNSAGRRSVPPGGGCPFTRRRFLAGCAACAAGTRGLAALAAEPSAPAVAGKPRIRLVFTHKPAEGPTWPNIGYDYEKRKKELAEGLARGCPGLEFVGPVTLMDAGAAKKLLADDKDIDGYLVYMVGIWTGAPQVIGASGKPALFVDDLYGGSGEFLIAHAAGRRQGWKVAGVSSSRFDDVLAAARCFEVLRQPGGSADAFVAAATRSRAERTQAPGELKFPDDPVRINPMEECRRKLQGMNILTVGGGWGMPASGKAIQEVFGPRVIPIEFKELHEAYLKADREQARQWADRWTKGAEKIVEPTPQDIEDSGAMHLAMLELLTRHKAQAITINCLGGFYGGHLKAYPCLGFCQMNNEDLVGACEGDLASTITMLVMKTLVGRPGYISDPVIDTSKYQIIYAHCVAPTKVFGPQGPSNPYHIRSHSEDRKGAAMRSLLPLGRLTTTMEIKAERREVILHQAVAAENVDEDKACRTKLAATVRGDMEKLLAEWDRWGWHRVTFYGDLAGPVEELAAAFNLKVVREA